jgi:hypothetical protein
MIAREDGARCGDALQAQIRNPAHMAGAIGAWYPKTYPIGAARHGNKVCHCPRGLSKMTHNRVCGKVAEPALWKLHDIDFIPSISI